MVLLPGIGGGKVGWPCQLEALAGAGYRAIAWDMPGYGESEMVVPLAMGKVQKGELKQTLCAGTI